MGVWFQVTRHALPTLKPASGTVKPATSIPARFFAFHTTTRGEGEGVQARREREGMGCKNFTLWVP